MRLIVAPGGRLVLALTFTVEGDKITEYTVIAAPERASGEAANSPGKRPPPLGLSRGNSPT